LGCLKHFSNKENLTKHLEYCQSDETVKTKMRGKGSILEFKNHKHSMSVPIAVDADFECFSKPIQSCQNNPEKCFTNAYQRHERSGFCYYIVCSGKKLNPVLYTKQNENENVGKIFVKRIELVWSSEVKSVVMTEEDKIGFNNAKKCWICEKEFTEGHKSVRDHCHHSGQFRGAAHQKCNSSFRKPKFVPISFHNLSGYDAHLFVKKLGK